MSTLRDAIWKAKGYVIEMETKTGQREEAQHFGIALCG